MASETIADIVAEMRELAADIETGNAVVGQTVWRNYADRFEAATKRETVGNEAAIRAALQTIHDRVNSLDEHCGVDPVEIRDIARAALAAPPRQCDVGNPGEQDDRYEAFCAKHFAKDDDPCGSCPLASQANLCKFAWAQTPYKEGGAK